MLGRGQLRISERVLQGTLQQKDRTGRSMGVHRRTLEIREVFRDLEFKQRSKGMLGAMCKQLFWLITVTLI